jgi:hypothetical protein
MKMGIRKLEENFFIFSYDLSRPDLLSATLFHRFKHI